MSAAGWFVRDGIDHGDEDRVVVPVSPAREPIDLDKVQETAWAVVGAVIYLLGVPVAAYGFGVWLGVWAAGVALLIAGALPSGYALRKASQRRAAREERAHQAAHQAAHRGDDARPLGTAIQVRP